MTKILSSLEVHYIRTTYMDMLLYIVIYRETVTANFHSYLIEKTMMRTRAQHSHLPYQLLVKNQCNCKTVNYSKINNFHFQ